MWIATNRAIQVNWLWHKLVGTGPLSLSLSGPTYQHRGSEDQDAANSIVSCIGLQHTCSHKGMGLVFNTSLTIRMLEIRFFVRNDTKTNIPNTRTAVGGGMGRRGGGRGGEKEGRKEDGRKRRLRSHRLVITGSVSPARCRRLGITGSQHRVGVCGSVTPARYQRLGTTTGSVSTARVQSEGGRGE